MPLFSICLQSQSYLGPDRCAFFFLVLTRWIPYDRSAETDQNPHRLEYVRKISGTA